MQHCSVRRGTGCYDQYKKNESTYMYNFIRKRMSEMSALLKDDFNSKV